MIPPLATADWRITCAFAAGMALLVLCLKLVSALRRPPPPGFWLTLLPSAISFRRITEANSSSTARAILHCASAGLGFAVVWLACWEVMRHAGAPRLALGWLAAPLVWLMGEMASALHQLLWLPSGRLMPAAHGNIFAARSLADFWGRRWNVWMSDWFRENIFLPLRARPLLAMLLVFVISGIIHEAVVNLGFWLLTGRNLFGSMMAYFSVQAAGMLVERKWLHRFPRVTRPFAWVVVLGPAPLFVNEAILRAYWLSP